MELALIVLYIIVNIVIVFIFYKKELGVFQAPFLVGCIGLTLMLPQLTTIYFMDYYYDSALLYKLCYVMITCNIAFAVGFNWGKKSKLPKTIQTFDLGRIQYITLFFSVIGFLTIFIYGAASGVDSVIAANLKIFAMLGLSLSLVTLLQGYRNNVVYASLVLSLIPIINYAFFIKGSRTDSLILFLNIFLFLALALPKKKKLIKFTVLAFLLLGSIMSASITELRHIVKGSKSEELSFWEGFKSSFTEGETELGMDLGNAALGIEYCYQNNSYDYGLQIWNGFVFNYVPKRLVGENVKQNLTYDAEYLEVVPILTNNVTTMTGYFYAFAAFSFYAFIFFLGIGYIYGMIWKRAGHSDFYMFLYFFVFTMVPAMISHGLQLFFSNLEFCLIFIYPILSIYMIKKSLRHSNINT